MANKYTNKSHINIQLKFKKLKKCQINIQLIVKSIYN